MKTRAAILTGYGRDWEVADVELDEPREREVLLRMSAAGLCHTEDHFRTGDIPGRLPIVGGHEGAGVVERVGPGVSRVAVGDHVICSFVPVCGKCRFCSTGHQNLCDLGAHAQEGSLPEGGFRFHRAGEDLGGVCSLGTFADHAVVSEYSCVPIRRDLPLDVAVLVSCGVPTGWGSAVNVAQVSPGETVVVIGVGGIGVNAVQGARHAGALHVVAADPVALKRETALALGATHAVASAEEASDLVLGELAPGVGADKVIIAVGVVDEDVVRQGFALVRKGGALVVTGASPAGKETIHVEGAMLGLFQKRILGTLFGHANPLRDIPALLELYRGGMLKLDELITRRYGLEQVNEGYRDLLAGRIVRGVIVFGD